MYEVTRGVPQPLGATPDATGVNFSVYSESAYYVELLLFDRHDSPTPSHVIRLDPDNHRSFHFWHCHVAGVRPGQIYAFRADGPRDTEHGGFRFNPNKVLADPYARGNDKTLWDRAAATGDGDNVATSIRSVVLDPDDYDWEGDEPLRRPLSETIIYEMHVGGFTRSPSSGVAHPGTFRGVIEKIDYLKNLGITAVELMPVFDFDETEVLRTLPDGTQLRNYWGYDPFGFFAPHSGYCTQPEAGSHQREFRDMVKALHAAGIEVILDVVFNHTSEGDHRGPTISFKGLANETYYHLWAPDRRYYMNFSGCGNTLNANSPVTAKLIVECLEHWVREYHVDGFRFDLAAVLSRGPNGVEMDVPPVLWAIELSEVLAETKIIAEPWDAAGLYELGDFPGKRWSQWNGLYRDQIRRFVAGEPGLVGSVAARLAGSADLFAERGELATNSINFITAHDGFTLNDLVSYNYKHNEANGEGNRDGSDANYSWNCGIEGPTDDPAIEALRARQIRNFVTILMLSRGVPMLLYGDEVRRTQRGNNNTYCQDNELAWFDWTLLDKNADVLRFFREIIAFRKRFQTLREPKFFSGETNARGVPDVSWHGTRLGQPGWDDPNARALSLTLGGLGDDPDLHVLLNMFDLGLDFELPQYPGRRWLRAVDTAKPSPEDILPAGSEVPVDGSSYHAYGHSVVVLISAPVEGR